MCDIVRQSNPETIAAQMVSGFGVTNWLLVQYSNEALPGTYDYKLDYRYLWKRAPSKGRCTSCLLQHCPVDFDLPKLQDEIEEAEQKVDELEALLEGQKPRRAVAIIPRDW